MINFIKSTFRNKNEGFDANGFPTIDPRVLEEAEKRVSDSSLRDATTSPGAAPESGRVPSTNKNPTFVTGAQINRADEMIKDPSLKDAELL